MAGFINEPLELDNVLITGTAGQFSCTLPDLSVAGPRQIKEGDKIIFKGPPTPSNLSYLWHAKGLTLGVGPYDDEFTVAAYTRGKIGNMKSGYFTLNYEVAKIITDSNDAHPNKTYYKYDGFTRSLTPTAKAWTNVSGQTTLTNISDIAADNITAGMYVFGSKNDSRLALGAIVNKIESVGSNNNTITLNAASVGGAIDDDYLTFVRPEGVDKLPANSYKLTFYLSSNAAVFEDVAASIALKIESRKGYNRTIRVRGKNLNLNTLVGDIIKQSNGLYTIRTTYEVLNKAVSGDIYFITAVDAFDLYEEYYVKTTNGTTSFTLSETLNGPAITTTVGGTKGLTVMLEKKGVSVSDVLLELKSVPGLSSYTSTTKFNANNKYFRAFAAAAISTAPAADKAVKFSRLLTNQVYVRNCNDTPIDKPTRNTNISYTLTNTQYNSVPGESDLTDITFTNTKNIEPTMRVEGEGVQASTSVSDVNKGTKKITLSKNPESFTLTYNSSTTDYTYISGSYYLEAIPLAKVTDVQVGAKIGADNLLDTTITEILRDTNTNKARIKIATRPTKILSSANYTHTANNNYIENLANPAYTIGGLYEGMLVTGVGVPADCRISRVEGYGNLVNTPAGQTYEKFRAYFTFPSATTKITTKLTSNLTIYLDIFYSLTIKNNYLGTLTFRPFLKTKDYETERTTIESDGDVSYNGLSGGGGASNAASPTSVKVYLSDYFTPTQLVPGREIVMLFEHTGAWNSNWSPSITYEYGVKKTDSYSNTGSKRRAVSVEYDGANLIHITGSYSGDDSVTTWGSEIVRGLYLKE